MKRTPISEHDASPDDAPPRALRIAIVGSEPSIHVQRWAAWLAQRGHDVHVVTCGAWSGDGTWTTHDLGRPASRSGYFLRIGAARRVLKAINPDIVHAHHVTSYGMLARMARLDRPLVATCHGSDVLVSPERSWLLRQVVRSVLRRADAITAPAEHVSAAAARVGGTGAVAPIVLQYGVEVDRLAGVGDEVRARRPPFDVVRLVVARAHEPIYRNHLVLEAAAELRRRGGMRVEVDMYGGGSLEAAAREQVLALELAGTVRIHGAVDSSELERAIARADLCISASASDGTSLALLETMAIGTPALCVRIAATQGWIEDSATGLLCDSTATSMADAIERYATLDVARVRAAAREQVAARADRDECLGRIEVLYHALASAAPSGADDARAVDEGVGADSDQAA